jgi:hypothetical protein
MIREATKLGATRRCRHEARCVEFQSIKDGLVTPGVGFADLLAGRIDLVDKDAVVLGPGRRVAIALTLLDQDLIDFEVMLPVGHPRTREALLVYIGPLMSGTEAAREITAKWDSAWHKLSVTIVGAHWCGSDRWRVDLEPAA